MAKGTKSGVSGWKNTRRNAKQKRLEAKSAKTVSAECQTRVSLLEKGLAADGAANAETELQPEDSRLVSKSTYYRPHLAPA